MPQRISTEEATPPQALEKATRRAGFFWVIGSAPPAKIPPGAVYGYFCKKFSGLLR